jgi:hypothetical protein
VTPAAQRPLILLYDRMWDRWPDFTDLPAEDAALYTTDRARFAGADMVVFHVPTIRRVKPWRLRKRRGQLWVAWSMESVENYPLLEDARSAAAFDLTMTYERGADVWTPYIPPTFEERCRHPAPPKTEAAPLVMFQSSAHDRSGRIPYAAALMRHIRIDSFGAILNNRTLPEADRGILTKRAVAGRYRFCIAFENSIAPDYVTEKLFDAYLAGAVPVYRGAPNVADFAPAPGSYIDAAAFPDPAALAAHLHEIAGDEAAYASFHRWRERPLSDGFRAHLAAVARPYLSRLADLGRERLASIPSAPVPRGRPLAHLEPPRPLPRRVGRWLGDLFARRA